MEILSSILSKDQIEDLITYCGSEPTMWKDDDMLICCPVHGESHPSMGVSAEKQICHCFSCGFAGDFSKLLMYSLPDEFGFKDSDNFNIRAYRKAHDFLISRYELEVHELGAKTKSIKRFEACHEKKQIKLSNSRNVIPRFKLAPFKSGKETYKYFFDRGFTKQDMIDFSIGRDTDSKTVTIPVFYEDKQLAGVIGRYIASNRLKNQRYKIYDNFERSNVLYPLDHFKEDDTIIIVEGQFDAIRMHKLGYRNTLSPMTNSLSYKQCEWICSHCSKLIWVGDNDERGFEGRESSRKILKNKVEFLIVDYPDYGKDVCDWSDEDIHSMIKNAHSIHNRRIKRK